MNFVTWIVFGAIAGWIASIVMGRNRQMGAIANIVVGVIGAFIGGYFMEFLGEDGVTDFSFTNLLVAIGGAIVLLFITGLFSRRRR